ncbi:MAG: recombinase RecA, partial [Acidobacteriales bacterium]|nr:recombinase RecA [Terriglobales bacterium]
RKQQPWTRLDQALRATDLLLQSGGFAAIVLDLADESIEHARRIPLATWFRYRQAADRTRCSLVVIGKSPSAQSSAAVVLECRPASVDSVCGTVIRNFSYYVHRQRERFSPNTSPVTSPVTSIDRKPPASTWTAQTAWDSEKRA